MNKLLFKDDENAAKLSKPCTESLSRSEKEIARILGPQTFTGRLDSVETFGENNGFVSLSSPTRLASLNINY